MGGDLAPREDSGIALTGPLHTVTLLSTNLEENLLFYRDGWGLRVRGPIPLDAAVQDVQRRLWGIPEDIAWQLYLFDRPGAPGNVRIRLLLLSKPTPNMHTSWDSSELGPFSLGFPNVRQAEIDKKLRRLGFGAKGPMQEYRIGRPGGGDYGVQETIFNGPDFVKGVGIYRGDGMSQLAPVDPETGLGGPGYSAQMLREAQPVLDFYTGVLGMELRSDREWTTSGALGVPAGTRYRFALVYARGASHGHLLFLQLLNHPMRDPGIPPRPPHRGLAMWSFPTTDLDQVLANAEAAGIRTVGTAVSYTSPSLGQHRAATLLAPNGFLVEIFETNEMDPDGRGAK